MTACCPCAEQAEQEIWDSATTIADLGELTARWLEGSISFNPNYSARPASETTPHVPTLAALNRAGFATEFSQPGEVRLYDPPYALEDHYELDRWQRAVVSGVMEGYESLCLLYVCCDESGLDIEAHRGPRLDEDELVPMSFGGALTADPTSPEHFAHQLSGWWVWPSRKRVLETWNHAEGLHEALETAWYVTVSDPEVGHNDRLWPALDSWINERKSKDVTSHD